MKKFFVYIFYFYLSIQSYSQIKSTFGSNIFSNSSFSVLSNSFYYGLNLNADNYSEYLLPFGLHENILSGAQPETFRNLNEEIQLLSIKKDFYNTLEIFTGSETGDPLFLKVTNPQIQAKNKNKILPSVKLKNRFSGDNFEFNLRMGFNGYFLTGQNLDDLLYNINYEKAENPNLKYSFYTDFMAELGSDWKLKNKTGVSYFSGFELLPYFMNYFNFNNRTINNDLVVENKTNKIRINFCNNRIQLNSPYTTKSITNFFNVNYEKTIKLSINELKVSGNYSFANITSAENIVKNNIQNQFGLGFLYRIAMNNLKIDFTAFGEKNYSGKFAFNFASDLLIGSDSSKFHLNINYKKNDYTNLFQYNDIHLNYYLQDWNYKYFDDIAGYNYINIESGFENTNELWRIFTEIEFETIDNYFVQKFFPDGNTISRQIIKQSRKNILQFKTDFNVYLHNFDAGIMILYSPLKTETLPMLVLRGFLERELDFNAKIRLEYENISYSDWEMFNSIRFIKYIQSTGSKNVFNFSLQQEFSDILSLKNIQAKLYIFNIFDTLNRNLPIGNNSGRLFIVKLTLSF